MDLTYELDCRGFIASWNHSLVNTTLFRVTLTTNEEKLYENTTANTSFHYTTVGWNRSAEYEVTVQALNPSGASLTTAKKINLNKTLDSSLDITKHLVRMNNNGVPTIQVTFEPFTPDCPLIRPPYLHAFITCRYEGQERRHIHLSAEIKDGESSVVLNLREIRTSRHCEATLSVHGRNLSTFDFSMFDVQNVTIQVDGNFVLVQCFYALNSQARGCCIKSATQRDLDPLWIERNNSTIKFGPLRNGSHHFIVSSSQRCDFTEVDYTTTISLMYSSNGNGTGPIAGILVLLVIILIVAVVGSVACYRHFTSKKRTINSNEGDGQNESQRETDLSHAVSESSATITDDSLTNLLSNHKKGESELVRNSSVIPKSPSGAVLSIAPRPIAKNENEFEMTSKEPDRETGEGLSKMVPSAQTKPGKISQLVPAPPPTTQNKLNTVFSEVPPTCKHDGDMGYLQNSIPESEN